MYLVHIAMGALELWISFRRRFADADEERTFLARALEGDRQRRQGALVGFGFGLLSNRGHPCLSVLLTSLA
jgi:hypothetical protein